MITLQVAQRPILLDELKFDEIFDVIVKSGFKQYDEESGRDYFTASPESELWPVWLEYLRLLDYLRRWDMTNPLEIFALTDNPNAYEPILLPAEIYEDFTWEFHWFEDWEFMPQVLRDAWEFAYEIGQERYALEGLDEYRYRMW